MSELTTEQDAVSSEGAPRSPRIADADNEERTATAAASTDRGDVEVETAAGHGADSGPEYVADDEVSSAISGGTDDAVAGSPETETETEIGSRDATVSGEALLVQEGEIAGDYLEQLLDILDYDGDIDLDVEGGRAIVAIVGANDLDPLVGARGVTLDALQELTRLTVAQQTGVRTRLMLDVGGYRAGRRTELSELAATSVARVTDSGEIVRMSPMNAFERKIVHDVVTATDGVRSESEGEDPDRRVVILPDR